LHAAILKNTFPEASAVPHYPLVLAQRIPFKPSESAGILAEIPAKPGIFLLRGHEVDAEPYVSKTADLRRRLNRLLAPAETQSKRLNLRERVAEIEYTVAGSDFESRLLLYRTLRQIFPEGYRRRIKLGPPALAKINWENAYPRAYVTRRPGQLTGKSVYYGPFLSKPAAEKFLNDVLDLFKSRRCTDDLNPDPSFPGCIYSEMKMCLAPCFKGCTDEEYFSEVTRVQMYLETRGGSLVQQLSEERDAASAGLEFERAAAIHARIDKVRATVTGLPEIVQRLDQLHAVVIQPSATPESVALFEVRAGLIDGPAIFSVQQMIHPNSSAGSTSLYAYPHVAQPVPETATETKVTPQTFDARVLDSLKSIEHRNKASVAERAEELALLKQWYYRSSRVGEIFFADEHGQLPVRRIVRGISRVYRGEKEQSLSTEDTMAHKDPQ
jgi:excinuclease ABC subunit C